MLAAVKRMSWAVLCLAVLVGAPGTGRASEQEFIDRAVEYLEAGDVAAAVIELKNAVQANPDRADARALLGEAYLRSGDAPSAVKELQRARELGPFDDRLRLLLAEAHVLVGEFQPVLDEVAADQPLTDEVSAGLLAARGQALFGLGQFAEAEETLQRVIAEIPVAPAYHGLGRLALFQGDPAKAGQYIDAGLAKFPDSEPLALLKAEQLLQAREFEAARAAFAKLEEQDPDNLAAAVGLARTELALNQPAEARILIDDLLYRFPNNYALVLLRGVAALQAKDYLAAQTDANAVRAVADDNAPALYVAGAASYGLGQYEQAHRALVRYVAMVPGDPAGRKLLAATQVRLGDPEGARRTLGDIPEGADPEYLSLLGAATTLSGDVASGLEYLEQAVMQSPEDARLRAQLGMMRIATGDPTQGQMDLDQALGLDPSLADDPRYDRAEIALIQGYLLDSKFDEALAAVEKWRSRHPGDATGAVMQGVALASRGDTAAAKDSFREALTLNPTAIDARTNLAILHLRENDPESAKAILEEALEHNPDDLRALLLLAQVSERSGEREETRRWLERAIGAHPDSLDTRIFLARLYFDLREPQKAIDAAAPVLVKQPGNPAALEVTARAQMESGKIAEAVATYERLVREAPQAVQPKFELSQAYLALGDLAKARSSAEAAVETDPNHALAQLHLARVLMQAGDMAAAESVIWKLEQLYPETVEVKQLLGDYALATGDAAKALDQYERARKVQDSGLLAAAVARAQAALGQDAAAISTLETWVAAHPQDVQARMELHRHYMLQSKTDPAIANLGEVIALAPDYWVPRNELAWLLYERGELKAARPEAERANELAPNNPAVMDTLGVILLGLGETERATGLIRRAADGLPDNPQVAYHLAHAYAQGNFKDEAREILTSILGKHPSFGEREKAEALLSELGG